MNYLGHLYFSNNDTELMLSNLFGDFVKGKELGHYRSKTIRGITLHRSIDSYIDNHPAVRELLHVLYPQLPKVSGIAVDLFFDHLLAKNWEKYHPIALNDFLTNFYDSIDLSSDDFTPEFKNMLFHMVRVNWISYYPTLDGLNKSLHGVSSKISFENSLKDGMHVFLNNENRIESTFYEFMEDAINYFNEFNSK